VFTHKRRAKVVIDCACVFVVLVLSLIQTPLGAQNPPPKWDPPKSYYLVLGDSITYGYQAFKAQANLPPSAYNRGYVDAFATRLQQIRPEIKTANYGCPGESTDSFVNGPCLWTETGHQLHDAFSGSQLQAAIEFLRTHPGQASPITLPISIGTDPNLALKTRRGTRYYKVPALKGVWYRSMFGHNLWCATLEDWFDSHRTREDYVPTGFKPYGAKTFAVKGHLFGLALNAEDKRALIAFLRTL
jgi:hypothetical protein